MQPFQKPGGRVPVMVYQISDEEICSEEYGDEGPLFASVKDSQRRELVFCSSSFFSHCCALFCTHRNSTLLFSSVSALFAQKHRGSGVPSSSQVTHICYSGKPTMIASAPLLPQNATRRRPLAPPLTPPSA